MKSLEFSARRLSLSVEPSFWIVMGMLTLGGGLPSTGDGVQRVLLLFGVFALSLIVHEGGHACVVLLFGGEARIRLHGMGGETRHALKLPPSKQFLVTSAGPLAGIALAAASFILLRAFTPMSRLPHGAAVFLSELVRVNVFWSLLNLLPILPMDGGKLFALTVTARFGNPGLKFVYGVGFAFGGILALAFARGGQWFGAATFGFFAASSARAWRQLSRRAPQDDDPVLQAELQAAERLVNDSRNDEAMRALIQLRKKTVRGRIHEIATELLGGVFFRSGQKGAALELLKSVAEELSYPSRVILAALYCDSGQRGRALELGRSLFLEKRDPDVAYILGAACAGEGDAAGALRWLNTAVRGGLRHAEKRLSEPDFDSLRNSSEFAQLQRLARGDDQR